MTIIRAAILFCSICWGRLMAQPVSLEVELLSGKHGLHGNKIHCIWQGPDGYLWLGTDKGLNRYDGYNFTSFPLEQHLIPVHQLEGDRFTICIGTWGEGLYLLDQRSGKTSRISNKLHTGAFIYAIAYCQEKTYWVASENGLGMLILPGEKQNTPVFHQITLRTENKDLIQTGIRQVTRSKTGQLWLADWEGKVYALPETDWTEPVYEVQEKAVLLNRQITAMVEDAAGRIWLGTSADGVFLLDSLGRRLAHFQSDQKVPSSLSSNQVVGIRIDRQGSIWVATADQGLNKLLTVTEKGEAVFLNEANPDNSTYQNSKDFFTTFPDNLLTCMYFDRDDGIWVGTYHKGLVKVSPQTEYFKYYQREGGDHFTLAHRDVSIPLIAQNGDLWIGTWGGGLHFLSKQEKTKANPVYKRFKTNPATPHSISFDQVFPVYEDRRGNLWLGTNGGGLNFLAKEEKYKPEPVFSSYRHNSYDLQSLSNDSIWAIHEDRQGQLWVGTQNGLNKLQPGTRTFRRYLPGICVLGFTEDSLGNLWLGTENRGVMAWNISGDTLTDQFQQFTFQNKTYSLGKVYDLEFDQKGHLWLGTNQGLINLTRPGNRFSLFTVEDGLVNKDVESIQLDEKGRLWLGTYSGLSLYDPALKTFRNFQMSEGRFSNSFTQGASQGRDGRMYFGSRNGFYEFQPSSISTKSEDLPVHISQIKTGQQTLNFTKMYSFEKKPFSLPYTDRMLSIAFTALPYHQADNIIYTYQLAGVDPSWHITHLGEHRITYSYLPEGEYTFKVKAGRVGESGWGAETSFSVKVNPPWWRTNWSYALYLVIFFLVSRLLYRIRKKQRKAKEAAYRTQLEQEKTEKLYRLKQQFFTQVSHEFKTPLSLIKAPLDHLLSRSTLSGDERDYLELIQRNTQRMIRLIDQLLDFQKLSAGRITVKQEATELVGFVETLGSQFEIWAKQQRVRIRLTSNVKNCMVFLDKEKLETILYNLISNALKHAPQDSAVAVGIEYKESDKQSLEHLSISVKDEGPGIPNQKQTQIFEAFYTEVPYNPQQKGTGIGLALVKALTEALGWTVRVDSTPGEGACFQIDVQAELFSFERGFFQKELQYSANQTAVDSTDTEPLLTTACTLLLVEDHQDLNDYLRLLFHKRYRLLQARNGAEAWELLEKHPVDLVLTDWMMPVMSGVELCQKIKDTSSTSHLPVIMLTAKTAPFEQLEGIQAGADAYITKPFANDYLMTRVEKLIESRRVLKEQFKQIIQVEPSQLIITPQEEKFLKSAIDFVETQMEDANLTVEQLANAMAMSSTKLYRKLKTIANISPNEFIRNIRLKRAAQLLKETDHTIAEISYQVGFSSPKYFSKCFGDEYGQSPKSFREKE
ncbi:two-component regulator propeller domain-containing protein [Rapidithrix thailandica]|uniref:histidine kinase n=1 Tax=Rapidithrix thailandica TaxID=413964 RepID=A0AAW9S3J8_9BACT